jgi:RNA polymerase sigma-70 factor (ECF subfamily)
MNHAQSDRSCGDDEFVRRITASQRDLRAFIFGMMPNQADADDLLQEVNLALWRKRHLYDARQGFLRWAFGFALLEIRSFRSRSAKSRLWFNDSVLDLLTAEWPHDSSFNEQCRDALATCLQKLGGVERHFITSFYGQQSSAQDLANESGKPLSTVYKILTRAREALRACVKTTVSQAYHPA